MIVTIDVGPAPAEEDCAQVGTERFGFCARLECETYIAALIANYGVPPLGAYFRVTQHRHDFGSYYSVELNYDPAKPHHRPYAELVDDGLSTWAPLSAPILYNEKATPTVLYLTAQSVVLDAISTLATAGCPLLQWQYTNLTAAYPRAANEAAAIDTRVLSGAVA